MILIGNKCDLDVKVEPFDIEVSVTVPHSQIPRIQYSIDTALIRLVFHVNSFSHKKFLVTKRILNKILLKL